MLYHLFIWYKEMRAINIDKHKGDEHSGHRCTTSRTNRC